MILSLIPQNILPIKELEAAGKKIGEKIFSFDDREEAVKLLPEAEILLVFGKISLEKLEFCRKLKWLFSYSAGVEKLPFNELKEMNVIVTNTRGIHGPQMAEQTLGLMISFSRKLHAALRNQLKKKWDQSLPVDELAGKTLCVIGAGSIGSEIARKARAFGMTAIGLKRKLECIEDFDDIRSMKDLHSTLSEADYVVLITPLTDETHHLMEKKEFQSMKPTGIFINMSRGDTVDESALIEALRQGTIAGAGLDVFHEEPLPENSPFWEMENVVLTPHNSGITPHYARRAMKVFTEEYLLYRQGKPLRNLVDLNRKY